MVPNHIERDESARSKRKGLPATGLLLGIVFGLAACLTAVPQATSVATTTGGSTTPTAAPNPTTTMANDEQLIAPLGYPGKGTITFARDDPAIGDESIWLIDPDGSDETRLTVNTDWAGRPAPALSSYGCCGVFSPDGTRLAVAYDDNTGGGGDGTWLETRILNLDGSSASTVPVMCGGCESVMRLDYTPRAWSPDGRLLALESQSSQDPTRSGINIAPMTGPWLTQVAGNHIDFPVSFSPDGRSLLFVRLHEPDSSQGVLFELDVPAVMKGGSSGTRGAARQITPPGVQVMSRDFFGRPASWSPDGKQIVYAATDENGDPQHMSLFMVEDESGPPQRLTEPAAFVSGADWSPDGAWIAFAAHVGPGNDLFLIHPDGSGLTNLTADFAPGICCPHWSPDGTALVAHATSSTNEQGYLFIVPIDGSQIHQLTTVPGIYVNVSWGPASR